MAIPAMDQYAILYRDSRGEHRIPAMTQYAAYISPQSETINFAPDYNARYTILA
jgi:hypothetical protein